MPPQNTLLFLQTEACKIEFNILVVSITYRKPCILDVNFRYRILLRPLASFLNYQTSINISVFISVTHASNHLTPSANLSVIEVKSCRRCKRNKERVMRDCIGSRRKKFTNIPTNTGCGALVGIKLHMYRQQTRHATDMSSTPRIQMRQWPLIQA